MAQLPPDVQAYKKTSIFTEQTVPAGLLSDHQTKAGVWGLISVVSGSLQYNVPSRDVSDLLGDGDTGVIEPTVTHSVTPQGPVSFYVEFYR